MENPYFSNPPVGLDLTESRTESNNAIGIALFIMAVIAVVLRTIARLRFQNVSFAADDYLLYGGLFLCLGNLACCIAGGYYGLGKHIWSLGPFEMEKITVITFAYVYIYAWSVTLIKYSILLFYRRIFGMTWLAWWCVFLTTGYLITNHVVLPLYCKPLSYYWLQWYEPGSGHCPINEAKFYLWVGIINMFGDICILAVPIPALSKLQMPRGRKIAMYFIFFLGGFVCIASGIRIKVIVDLTKSRDISWAKSDVFIWSSVEPSVGIISCCLPTLRGLMIWTLNRCGLTGFLGLSFQDSDEETAANTGGDSGPQKCPKKPKRRRPNNYTSILNSITTVLRPDDEMCLTTIVGSGVAGSAASFQSGEAPRLDPAHLEPGEIVVHEHFRWSENKEATKSREDCPNTESGQS